RAPRGSARGRAACARRARRAAPTETRRRHGRPTRPQSCRRRSPRVRARAPAARARRGRPAAWPRRGSSGSRRRGAGGAGRPRRRHVRARRIRSLPRPRVDRRPDVLAGPPLCVGGGPRFRVGPPSAGRLRLISMTSVDGAVQTPQHAATAAAPARAGARPVLLAALGGCGALLACAYFVFLVVIPQTPVRLAKTSATLDHRLALWRWLRSLSLPSPEGRTLLAALVAAVVGAFVVYAAAVLAARALPESRRLLAAVVAVAVLFTAASALALPNLDTDVYTYIATGRVAAVHHRDPYAIATDRFRSDPFYKYELPQYTHYPDIKLPAWMPINIGLAEVAGNDPATALLVYRGAFAAFALANLALLLLIVRRLRPERLTEAAVAWGWNPLVVLFAQSKVDSVMVFFLLASVFAL